MGTSESHQKLDRKKVPARHHHKILKAQYEAHYHLLTDEEKSRIRRFEARERLREIPPGY